MSFGLTQQQSRLLKFIGSYSKRNGCSPSFDEMADAVGLASKSNVHRLLTALEDRGRIARQANRARSIEVIDVNGLARYSTMDLRRELTRRQEGASA